MEKRVIRTENGQIGKYDLITEKAKVKIRTEAYEDNKYCVNVEIYSRDPNGVEKIVAQTNLPNFRSFDREAFDIKNRFKRRDYLSLEGAYELANSLAKRFHGGFAEQNYNEELAEVKNDSE